MTKAYALVALALFSMTGFGCAHTATHQTAATPLFPCAGMRKMPLKAAKANTLHDFDGNGSISRAEYSCQIIHRFARHDQNKDHAIHTKQELSAKHTWHHGADQNKDQKISIMEFMKATDRSFNRADTNHDGMLSMLEAKESKFHP